jgi:hypothetical protein
MKRKVQSLAIDAGGVRTLLVVHSVDAFKVIFYSVVQALDFLKLVGVFLTWQIAARAASTWLSVAGAGRTQDRGATSRG